MYWSRTNSLIDIALYLLLSGGWALGGWLLATHAFHLHRNERLASGLAAGMLLFIGVSNLLAHLLPLTMAFWSASGLILLSGMASAWRSKLRPWLDMHDFHAWPVLIGLAALSVLFTLILRGQSIFDEYLHLPLISVMASGDIPPHFYLNPDFYFAYHYGIQVYAASLVRLADFFPWSAWDASRALAIAFTLVLGWVWVRRVTRNRIAAWLGSFLFTFGGGARWLLLLLPAPWLAWVSRAVNLVGTGLDTAPTLALALHRLWVFEGGGPAGLPFAYHNGIFIPVFYNLGSTGAMPYMTVLLLLLLLPRGRFSAAGLITWTLLFATLALSAEHLFAVIWAGIILAIGFSYILGKRQNKPIPKAIVYQWGIVLILSAIVSLVQGGFITETARNLLASVLGSATQSVNARGFSLRWPPGLLSAHLGSLSILNPGQLVALLAELGPALLLIPVIFIRFKKELKHRDWFVAGLALSAVSSLVFPLIFQYEVDRSITRMPATALWTCLVLGFPILWYAVPRINLVARLGVVLGYIVIVLAGVVIFRTQLYSIPVTQYSYYIDGLDASFCADYWNKLPPNAEVLDRVASRAVTIFGRITRANSSIYAPLPEWEALIADPDPVRIAQAGYDYVYMDRTWWDQLTTDQQSTFQQPCIDIIDERRLGEGVDYRLLVNVSGCRP
jgi:hypothetical protein